MILGNKSNRKEAMNRNWDNQKANPALKTKTGNKKKYYSAFTGSRSLLLLHGFQNFAKRK